MKLVTVKIVTAKMDIAMQILRSMSGFFAFLLIWTYFSFLEYQDMADSLRIWSIALALLVFATTPRRLLIFALTKVAICLLGALGIASSIPMMRSDLLRIHGADYPAFVLRGVMVAILLIMIIEPFLKKHKSKSVEQSGPGYPPQGVGSPDP